MSGDSKRDGDAQPFEDSRPLVFTHNDLSMRNILLGDDWKIWLIDWAWSGYYPPWVEHFAMEEAAVNDDLDCGTSWGRVIRFVTNPYIYHRRWWYTSVGNAIFN